MKKRFLMIAVLNEKISKILPLVDFSQASKQNTLACHITRLRHLIFFHNKFKAFRRILVETRSESRVPRVVISRPKALLAKEQGSDPHGKKSVFGQMYRALHFLNVKFLRRDDRQWMVFFEGEGGQDAGGLFRESISRLCDDITTCVPLFIHSPNYGGHGNHQDKYVPNPSFVSSLQLSMFSFIGKY
eukprot:UN34862